MRCPEMVCQSGGHRWCTLTVVLLSLHLAQAFVRGTEVVEGTHQPHTCRERLRFWARQRVRRGSGANRWRKVALRRSIQAVLICVPPFERVNSAATCFALPWTMRCDRSRPRTSRVLITWAITMLGQATHLRRPPCPLRGKGARKVF